MGCMLELRPVCENCAKALPPSSDRAFVCSFECTFCAECALEVLANVCPNCGGGFERRPVRPAGMLAKYPVNTQALHKPVDMERFAPMREKLRGVPPERR